MGVEQEIKDSIHTNWRDKKVADWVIRQLPLLEYGHTHPQCPIFKLDLNDGLSQTNPNITSANNFKEAPKIVISGGFEGTAGHIKAIKELWEIRALTSRYGISPIVIMLEPDVYIRDKKQREPLVNLQQRTELWSTSGLVDAVIVLPEVKTSENTSDHYSLIHKYIMPAKWCTNVENPHWKEVIMREGLQEIDLIKILIHDPSVHTSFLSSTKNLNIEEAKHQLEQYVSNLIKQPYIYNIAFGEPPKEIVETIRSRIAEEL